MQEEELTTIELDVVQEMIGMKELKVPLTYDPEKLKYNSKYQSFDFFAQKFPPGWEVIPGFDKVIEMCRLRGSLITPLQEIELKQPTEEERIEMLDKQSCCHNCRVSRMRDVIEYASRR